MRAGPRPRYGVRRCETFRCGGRFSLWRVGVIPPLFDGRTGHSMARAAVKTRCQSGKPFRRRSVLRLQLTGQWRSSGRQRCQGAAALLSYAAAAAARCGNLTGHQHCPLTACQRRRRLEGRQGNDFQPALCAHAMPRRHAAAAALLTAHSSFVLQAVGSSRRVWCAR